jgi:hypothetical protein
VQLEYRFVAGRVIPSVSRGTWACGGAKHIHRAARPPGPSTHARDDRSVIVTDPAIKSEIRIAAEKEERENYGGRMPEEWLRALAPLQTD